MRHIRKRHQKTAERQEEADGDDSTTDSSKADKTESRQDTIEEPRDLELEYDFDQNSRMIAKGKLELAVSAFLCKLVDEETRRSIGWPQITTSNFLSAVIRLCGHSAIKRSDSVELDCEELIRANLRLLFTEVEECSVQSFLDIKTVDEIVLYLIKMLD